MLQLFSLLCQSLGLPLDISWALWFCRFMWMWTEPVQVCLPFKSQQQMIPFLYVIVRCRQLQCYILCSFFRLGVALELTPADPRWVGAWWMGLLITAGGLALTSLPYYFFPRELHVEKVNHSFVFITNEHLITNIVQYCIKSLHFKITDYI